MSSLISEQSLLTPAQDPPNEAGRSVLERSSAEAPLSSAQQQIWIHTQLAPAVPLYNEVLILERTGSLNREILRHSVGEIIDRHEVLRSSIVVRNGIPIQVFAASTPVELSFTDQQHSEISREITSEAQRPFNLAEVPLIRIRVLRLSDEHHFIVLVVHAIIADQRSLQILARELVSCYEAYGHGEQPRFIELPFQYSEYAHRRRTWLQGVGEQQLSYWSERLADIPPLLDLPTDRSRPAVPTFRGAHQSLILPKELSGELKELSEREEVHLFIVLLATFQLLLSRYAGQVDIVTGFIAPGRQEPGTECLAGSFANTVAIRTNLEGDPPFRKWLSCVRDIAQEASEHQNVLFDAFPKEHQLHRESGRSPLFQTMFSVVPFASLAQPGWELPKFNIDTGTAKVELQLTVYEDTNCISVGLTYSTDLFEAATIKRMAGHYEMLLQGIAANPDQPLSSLPLLNEVERRQLLVEWNATQTEYNRRLCIHQLFEAKSYQTPNATAVVFEDESLTYDELNRRSNQLAHYLMKLGIGPEVLVGICVERSLEMVVGLLGILKAGGAYVPLDPAYPSERLSFMLEDAEAAVLVTQRQLAERLPQSRAKVLFLDTDRDEIAEQSIENPESRVDAENLAYVIYTSGSTGKPKGVQIPHRAVVNFLSSMMHCPGITTEDRLLAITTLSFDIAGLEIYLPISVGASLEIVSRDVACDGKQLISKLASSRPTLLQATPATWRMLLDAGWKGNRRLKALCGGEAWSRSLANQLIDRTESLWNMYGPTETTIWSTLSKVQRGERALTIGRPIANTEVYILDKRQQPVPVGVAGELYIGGDGLARGYLKRPELTAEKFIISPFAKCAERRLYKTGDLARYLVTGDIEFLGRIDHQVKIRGFRIEIGEIESALRKNDGVSETVVVAREDATGEQRLVAYFVPARDAIPTATELRRFLKEILPEHMVPSAFIALNAMPLTPNGKIDRRSLPAPEVSKLTSNDNFAAPRDSLEARLVKIWESVLRVRPIGVKHNFFELGGHSLVAAKLMHRVEEAFGQNLPIATLFQAPTVEQLALILRQNGWISPWSSLVPIQTGGSNPPFFCVHGVGSNVIRFRHLAQYLGSDRPFYALQAQGVNRNYPCHTRAEDMAAHYIEEIRSVQPHGPYLLGGYSFGGMVALEMAQQLIAQGEEPSLVILFDTLCTSARQTQLFQTASFVLSNIFQLSWSEKRGYLHRIATAPIRECQRRLRVRRLPRRIKEVRKACLEAARDYVPRPYPGRIVLFRSSHRPLTRFRDPYAPWATYATRGLEIYEMEGNHENILLEPQVQAVAEQLGKCLSDAQQEFSCDRIGN